MVRRARMAGLAVGGAHGFMVEISGFPGVGLMASRALTVKVVVRARVARLAISKTSVIKAGRQPGTGVVAGGALPAKMVCRAIMTGLAIGGFSRLVVKIRRAPGIGAVAGRTLSNKVIGRAAVTSLTVGSARQFVIEMHVCPRYGCMAGGTVPTKVIGWQFVGMAGSTLAGSSSELPVNVTLLARQLRVLPDQGKKGMLCSQTA